MSGEDDLGLFGPDSITWRVHAEPILLLGGLRSLYLQALHPRAIAGVVQNSGYKSDPWGRLIRTSTFVGTAIYGTTAQARAAGRRVQAVHAKLTAVDHRTGETFRIDDPGLLRWVHVTEVESFLTTARRAGMTLTDAEVDRYYTEQKRAAALVGLDPGTVPGTADEVAAYYGAVRPDLAMTKDAADTLLFLTLPPLPWQLRLTPARLVYAGVAGTALGMLPPWARRLYGGVGLPTTDLSATVSVRTLRFAMGLLPHSLYEGPLYKLAMARASRVAGSAKRMTSAVEPA
jgi:uncharacterized protein (DUF2236 family)